MIQRDSTTSDAPRATQHARSRRTPPAVSFAAPLAVCLLATLATLYVAAVPALALDVPPPPRGRVLDQAGLLSRSTVASLEQQIAAFEQRTSNQIAVAIFESLDGESLEDFSIRLAERWQPGQAERDNGVILVLFVKDRKARLEVGYGLEGALPDALASSIIRNVLAPEFRAGHYDTGVVKTVGAVMSATQGEYEGLPQAEQPARKRGFSLFSLMLIVIVLMGLGRGHRGYGSRGLIYGLLLGSLFGGRRGGGWGGGGFGGGGGGFGGGGFGGGGFGGGGASGGW